ncbi:MAG: HEAT repeat domain-containing protein [candidate division Zixibacteria bacterium]|nr:HEAT repeat domain-containing protein [candidate division Zixibacteria bacterium]
MMINKIKNVILKTGGPALLVTLILAVTVGASENVKKKVDSLFKIASSASVLYTNLVEPAKDSLAALGAPAVPYLIDKFTTKSARERWAIIHILQRIGSPAVPDLVEALNRPDGNVVSRVCWALGDIKDTSSVMPLIGVSKHQRWQVRDQVVGALGKISDHRAAGTVLTALDDTIPEVRKSAAVSCGKLLLRDGLKKLTSLLGDEFYGVRMTALDALMKMDTTAVIATLRDSINSDNEMLGNLACRILGRYGTDEALEILLEQTGSKNTNRRAHAAVAIISADPDDNCCFRRLFYKYEKDRLVRLKMESALKAAQDVQRYYQRPPERS